MFHGNGYYMGGMHGFWWLFWVLLIGMLLFFILRRSNKEGELLRETPHDILQRRLSSGEITPEEYETRKVLLDRDSRA